MKLKFYISGKIKGLDPEVVTRNFQEGENECLRRGLDVVNPTKLPHDHDKSYESYMAEDIYHLMFCDGIYMLGNWGNSKGARVEYAIARELGLKVIFQADQPAHNKVVVNLEPAVIRQRNHNVGEVTDTDF